MSHSVENIHNHLCGNCKNQILRSHFIQCQNCHSLVNLMPKSNMEKTTLVIIPFCSFCSEEQVLLPVIS